MQLLQVIDSGDRELWVKLAREGLLQSYTKGEDDIEELINEAIFDEFIDIELRDFRNVASISTHSFSVQKSCVYFAKRFSYVGSAGTTSDGCWYRAYFFKMSIDELCKSLSSHQLIKSTLES